MNWTMNFLNERKLVLDDKELLSICIARSCMSVLDKNVYILQYADDFVLTAKGSSKKVVRDLLELKAIELIRKAETIEQKIN